MLACFPQHDSSTAEVFITRQTRTRISSEQSLHIAYNNVGKWPYADQMLCISPWGEKQKGGPGNPLHRIQRLDLTKHKSHLNRSPCRLDSTGSTHCNVLDV